MSEQKEFYLYQKMNEARNMIEDAFNQGYTNGYSDGYLRGKKAAPRPESMEKPNRLFLYPEILMEVMKERNISAEDIAEASDIDLKASTVKGVLEDEHRTRTATVLTIQSALRNLVSEDEVNKVFRYV